jgi:hypothetical protein
VNANTPIRKSSFPSEFSFAGADRKSERPASILRSVFGQRWRRIREPLGPMKARDEATGSESSSPLPTARATRPESERLERPAH